MEIQLKIMGVLCILLILLIPVPGVCGEMSTEDILKELQVLKERVDRLEREVRKKDQEIEALRNRQKEETEHYHSVKGLADRVRRIEDSVKKEGVFGKWADRISLSGVVEVEAAYEKMAHDDPAEDDRRTSDITLATVELGVDADIAKHVKGHILLLWEEDETEPVDLDEGFIVIDGKDVVPFYLNAGKMYVPFGRFESHFISDPLTLELGETNETALKVGFAKGWVELCGSVFNGDIDENGQGDHVESFAGAATFTLPEGRVPGLGLTAGASYISNIADSDSLQDEDGVDFSKIQDHVPGFSAFLSLAYQDKVFLEMEYVGAMDEFGPGELAFDGGRAFEPRAWNFEAAFMVRDGLEIGIRYEGGDDLGDFLPEEQYGLVINYSLFENTSLALEYLHGEFDNNDERDVITSQLSISF